MNIKTARDAFRNLHGTVNIVFKDDIRAITAARHKIREEFEKKAATEAEESTWKLVSDSDNPEDFRFFLEKYPDSPYAVPAQLRLKQLERKAE